MTDSALTIATVAAQVSIGPDGLLAIPADLDFDRWRSMLHALKQAKGCFNNVLRQAVDFGCRTYGSKPVEETLQQLEFDLSDARHALAYAQTSDTVRNKPLLTDEQRFVVARAFPDDPAKQEEWADKAATHKLNAAALKVSIETGEISKPLERTPGVVSLEHVATLFQRCITQQGAKLKKLPRKERTRIAKLLQPVRNFVEEMEA
jgi:hypothetical protein